MMPARLSVCPSAVTEVHWRIIAELQHGRRPLAVHAACSTVAVLLIAARLLAVLFAGRSSPAMLASARLSCYFISHQPVIGPILWGGTICHALSLLLLWTSILHCHSPGVAAVARRLRYSFGSSW